jgi:hypothetical protein
MEGPPSPGATPEKKKKKKKKKKRNPSFRRMLRDQGVDVVSIHVSSSLSVSRLLVVPSCPPLYPLLLRMT